MNTLQDLGEYMGKVMSLHQHSKQDNVMEIATSLPATGVSEGYRVVIKEGERYYVQHYMQAMWHKTLLQEGDTFYCLGDKKEYRVIGDKIEEIKQGVINDLTTGGVNMALSAEMGKKLGEVKADKEDLEKKADKEDVERIKATNVGKEGASNIFVFKREDWLNKPLGWTGIISYGSGGTVGLPNNEYYYGVKLGVRDTGGGYKWLITSVFENISYIGTNWDVSKTDGLPVWTEISLVPTTPKIYSGSDNPSGSIGKLGDIYIKQVASKVIPGRSYQVEDGWEYKTAEDALNNNSIKFVKKPNNVFLLSTMTYRKSLLNTQEWLNSHIYNYQYSIESLFTDFFNNGRVNNNSNTTYIVNTIMWNTNTPTGESSFRNTNDDMDRFNEFKSFDEKIDKESLTAVIDDLKETAENYALQKTYKTITEPAQTIPSEGIIYVKNKDNAWKQI